jgi:hypothetical protein
MAAQSDRVVSLLKAQKRLLGELAVAVASDAEGGDADEIEADTVAEVGAGPAESSVGRFVSDASEPFPMERRLLLKTASRFINAHKHKRQW